MITRLDNFWSCKDFFLCLMITEQSAGTLSYWIKLSEKSKEWQHNTRCTFFFGFYVILFRPIFVLILKAWQKHLGYQLRIPQTKRLVVFSFQAGPFHPLDQIRHWTEVIADLLVGSLLKNLWSGAPWRF